MKITDLQTRDNPNWCPGCGNFGIQASLKQAIVNLEIEPHNVAISTGIGCAPKINQWVNTYGFAGLHGRSLPVAMGIKLANPELTVIAASGDGDGYGIGTCHFIHTMRRNLDMTYITHNNQVYGLTLGQTSPTSEKGSKGPSTPQGVLENPVNPLRLALSSECTFVARGFAGDIVHLTSLIQQGIEHRGFALIDVLQPCVTFNKVNTFEYFRERCYKLEDEGHDVGNMAAAFEKAGEWGDKIPIGVFYKTDKPTYEDGDVGLASYGSESAASTPVSADISGIDVGEIVDSFM